MKPQVAVSNELKIDKGIPRPSIKVPGNTGYRKYPFPQMDVGDSIFTPGGKVNGRVINAARAWAKANKNGREFSARTVTEDGVKGVRVWRTA